MTAASDSAGIRMVPLTELAPHPLNPRRGLDDLAELAASIAAQGLFEPLVVLSAGAHAEATRAAGGAGPGPGITHVIVMGHRRHAAARRAPQATAIPRGERDPWGRPLDETVVLVLKTWAYDGTGYTIASGAEQAVASAARAREHDQADRAA